MTPEEQDYFKMMEDLFAHPGWKRLVEDAKAQIYQLQSDALDVCRNWDEVVFRRGQAAQLNELVRLPDILDSIRQQKEEEEDASVQL